MAGMRFKAGGRARMSAVAMLSCDEWISKGGVGSCDKTGPGVVVLGFTAGLAEGVRVVSVDVEDILLVVLLLSQKIK